MEVKRELNKRYERINKISELISQRAMSTSEIALKLGLSTKTIQRDLNQVLAKNGALKVGKK